MGCWNGSCHARRILVIAISLPYFQFTKMQALNRQPEDDWKPFKRRDLLVLLAGKILDSFQAGLSALPRVLGWDDSGFERERGEMRFLNRRLYLAVLERRVVSQFDFALDSCIRTDSFHSQDKLR
jgi:hypothetical protein